MSISCPYRFGDEACLAVHVSTLASCVFNPAGSRRATSLGILGNCQQRMTTRESVDGGDYLVVSYMSITAIDARLAGLLELQERLSLNYSWKRPYGLSDFPDNRKLI